MKKIKLILVILTVGALMLSPVSMRKSEAAVVGLGTGILGLTIGGVACLAAAGLAAAGADSATYSSDRSFWGTVAIVLWITGVTLDKDGAIVGKETAAFNMTEDLSQKVEDGIYTEAEAKEILADYTEEWGEAQPTDIIIDTHGKKSQEILKEFMDKTNLSELTSSYFLSLKGIQVN